MTAVYVFDGSLVRALGAPSARPLRWAAWHPDGSHALIVGNRGTVLRFEGERFDALDTGSTHNLRGVGFSPDAQRTLMVGNRGAVLLHDGRRFRELPRVTDENLRRVAWSPDGAYALIVGNGGCVLRFDAAGESLTQVPGDRAHTLRSIAWRPDGEYALVGGYASRRAGYPPPHALYRCDGRYLQGILATDDEDDAIAIDWRPSPASNRPSQPSSAAPHEATILVASYSDDGGDVANKIVEYDGHGVQFRTIAPPATLLGAAWHPDGKSVLLCGENGALVRDEPGKEIATIPTNTTDNLIGPFWQPHASAPIALMLKGPDEKVYTA